MLQAGRDLDLAEKAVAAKGRGQLGLQHLHRNLAAVPEVLRQVDGRHAPATELPLEQVAVTQGLGEPGIDRSHQTAWRVSLQCVLAGSGSPAEGQRP